MQNIKHNYLNFTNILLVVIPSIISNLRVAFICYCYSFSQLYYSCVVIHSNEITIATVTAITLRQWSSTHRRHKTIHPKNSTDLFTNKTSIIHFERLNNETGADYFVIPNIVHFARFNKSEFSFGGFICLQSAYRYQRPNQIFVHTNVESGFKCKYWSFKEKYLEIRATIKISPFEIFGLQLNPAWRYYHGSDISSGYEL